ncbi:MAG TPA: CRISPR-associated endonuclease Cas6 [Flavilitoribacter sp.]|nr:CRISPR-associated endonuclease Cas6 [Flavilitoribacter sp.]
MQIITLTFPFSLHPTDIPAFRAAIVEVVGLGHHLFHNHDNSVPGQVAYHQEYPLIRFAVRKGRAQITGIGPGADAVIRHLLPVLPETLVIAGRPCTTSGYTLRNRIWDPELSAEPRLFGLVQWLALNKENYRSWKSLEGNPEARMLLLDRCLTGQLRMMAERLAPELDRRLIAARVVNLDRVKRITWHGVQLIGFYGVAEANFLPPAGLGVGRCSSFGFGEITGPRTYSGLMDNWAQGKRENPELEVDEELII